MLRLPGVLLLAVGAVVLGAGTAAADDSAPWQVKTAANSYGSNRANYSYTVAAGGQVQDAFVVVNRGKAPLELAVSAGDAFTTSSGELDLRGPDSKDLGTWVHADRKQVRVLPGKSVQVPFKIAVPADARPGDHLGGVITSLTQNDVERRLAIRIRLRVSGALEPSLSVEDLKVRYAGNGDATVAYEIHNTGNTIAAARQTASVSGPFGQLKSQSGAIADSPQLLPGESWKVSVPVKGVTPAGRLTGAVELLPLVTDAAGSTATFAAVQSTTHAWTIPWVVLLLLVLVVVGAVLLIRRRYSRAS
ncbi:WxL protein peptidoglycan domain-containing protein [Kribbella sp. NPDC051620]|uniref:WxL protein peptidoglycan domain-containing protein n=1 Tax=Kribbella sp. NPDC051620 TaxID=3364120 RepID=UPI0037BC875F